MASANTRRLAVGGAILAAIVALGAVLATTLDQPGYALAAAGIGVVALFVLIALAKREKGQ